jgi:hypothetical protein
MYRAANDGNVYLFFGNSSDFRGLLFFLVKILPRLAIINNNWKKVIVHYVPEQN